MITQQLLPHFQRLYEKQKATSEKLEQLIAVLSSPREPIEPTLRMLLKPLDTEIVGMAEELSVPLRQPGSKTAS